MNCRKARVLLPDYLDGRIDQSEMKEIAAHIRECRDCAEEHRFLTWYRKLLEDTTRVNAPPDFLEQVTEKVSRITRRGIFDAIFSPPVIKIPIQAAALIAIAVIAVLFIRPAMRYEKSPRTQQDLSQTLSRDTDHKGREGAADRARDEIAIAPSRGEKEKASPMVAQPPAGTSPAKRVASEGPASPVVVYLSAYRPSSTLMKSEAVNDNAPQAGKAIQSAEDTKSDKAPSSTLSEFDDTDYILDTIRKASGRIIRMDYDAARGEFRTIVTEMPAAACSQFMDTLRNRWRVQQSAPAPCGGGSKVVIELHISD